MPLSGDYEPSPEEWVRDNVQAYESTDGAEGGDMRGMPIIVMTTKGAKTGKLRKVPLMRVESEGTYAVVASLGGAPKNPVWYHNLIADPHVELQDGPVKHELVARELNGDEKAVWWERAVAAFPDYASYQRKTTREIPVFVLEPVASQATA